MGLREWTLAPRRECPPPPFSPVAGVGSLAEGCKNCQNCRCHRHPDPCRGSGQPRCLLPSLRPVMVVRTTVAVEVAWLAVADAAAAVASPASAGPQAVEAVAAVSSAAQQAAFAAVVLVALSPGNQ